MGLLRYVALNAKDRPKFTRGESHLEVEVEGRMAAMGLVLLPAVAAVSSGATTFGWSIGEIEQGKCVFHTRDRIRGE